MRFFILDSQMQILLGSSLHQSPGGIFPVRWESAVKDLKYFISVVLEHRTFTLLPYHPQTISSYFYF